MKYINNLLAVIVLTLVATSHAAVDPQKCFAYTQNFADTHHVVVFTRLNGEDYRVNLYKNGEALVVFPDGKGLFLNSTTDTWINNKTKEPADLGSVEVASSVVRIIDSILMKPVYHDMSQGGLVWRPISETSDANGSYFSFAQSRENPKPNALYPIFQFIRPVGVTSETNLLLHSVTANVHFDGRLVPLVVRFDYMIPVSGTVTTEVLHPGQLPPYIPPIPPDIKALSDRLLSHTNQ